MKATYPWLLDPLQPFEDDHWILAGIGYEDFRRYGGRLDRATYEQRVRDFLTHPTAELEAELGLDRPPRPEYHAPERVPWVPSPSDLVRIGTDIEPALGGDAPDLVLGPWADDPLPRPVLRMATAELLFAHLTGEPRSAWRRWKRRVPLPPVPDRAAVRGVARAPLTVWSIEGVEGDLLQVRERLGISAKHTCSEVLAPERVSVDGGEDTLVARVVATETDRVAAIAFTVGGEPDQDWLEARLEDEWRRARLVDRRISKEQLLRTRGFVIARRIHARAFAARLSAATAARPAAEG